MTDQADADRLAAEAFPGDLWNEQAYAQREAFSKGYVVALEAERARSAKLIEALKKYRIISVPLDGRTGVCDYYAQMAIADYEKGKPGE